MDIPNETLYNNNILRTSKFCMNPFCVFYFRATTKFIYSHTNKFRTFTDFSKNAK